jgi:hypothetical protein
LEVAVEGKLKISTKDLANATLDFDVKTEKALDFSVTGADGGSIFFKPERMRLKREKREEIVDANPKLNKLSDENLLAMIPPKDFTSASINDIIEFSPVTMEDIDELMGEEMDAIV